MLALEPGARFRPTALAEGLWGDEPPPSAREDGAALRLAPAPRCSTATARGSSTRGRGYELQLPDGEVDAARVERLLGESRAARGARAVARRRRSPIVADEPFAAAEIRRLEELRLRATEMAIDADLAAGRHAELIGELDALVARAPAARAPARAADARAVPRRPPVRGARRLPRARARRSSSRSASSRAPSCGALHEAILAQDPALDLPRAGRPGRRAGARRRAGVARRPRRRRRAPRSRASRRSASSGPREPDSLPGIDEDHVGVIDPRRWGHHAPSTPSAGPRARSRPARARVWVANRLDGTVSRIDRGRDAVVTIPVGGAPSALAFGAGSLWVADGDAALGRTGRPGREQGPAADPGRQRAALAGGGGGRVVGRLGRRRQRAAHRPRPRPRQSRGSRSARSRRAIAAGAGALWVTSEEAGTVTRIEPRTGARRRRVNVGNGPTALAVGEGASGSSTVATARSRASIPPRTRWQGGRRRQRPDRRRRRRRGGLGGRAARRDRRPRRSRGGPARRPNPDGQQSCRDRGRRRVGVDGSAPAPEAAHRGGTLRVVMPRTASTHQLAERKRLRHGSRR